MSVLNVVYEDSELLVINKPAGLIVNKSETTKEETLQDLISIHLDLVEGDLGIGDRAGIVHRLDKETSGLIVVAKAQKAFEKLQGQFKNREVKKEYLALVHGDEITEGVVGEAIGRIGRFGKFGVVKNGREAETAYKKISSLTFDDRAFSKIIEDAKLNKQRERYLVAHARNYSLVSLFPKTGRTHQIRVHLKYIGHPVVSDTIYAPSKLLKFDKEWCPRLFLHAKKISFVQPSRRKVLEFSVDLPDDLKNAMLNLKKI